MFAEWCSLSRLICSILDVCWEMFEEQQTISNRQPLWGSSHHEALLGAGWLVGWWVLEAMEVWAAWLVLVGWRLGPPRLWDRSCWRTRKYSARTRRRRRSWSSCWRSPRRTREGSNGLWRRHQGSTWRRPQGLVHCILSCSWKEVLICLALLLVMNMFLASEAQGICQPCDFEEASGEGHYDTSLGLDGDLVQDEPNAEIQEEEPLVEHWFDDPMVPRLFWWIFSLFCAFYNLPLFLAEFYWQPGCSPQVAIRCFVSPVYSMHTMDWHGMAVGLQFSPDCSRFRTWSNSRSWWCTKFLYNQGPKGLEETEDGSKCRSFPYGLFPGDWRPKAVQYEWVEEQDGATGRSPSQRRYRTGQ